MSILASQNDAFAAWQQETAERVRDGGPFLIRGQGTSGIGLAAGEALHGCDQGWDYDPSALTLTVASGVPLEEVEQKLAVEGQRLAFEPPKSRGFGMRSGAPTIGGVVAGNLSGPRRVASGACRDFCLGVGFIDGRGQIISNGGRVMKNVTGYDLVKLMAGSHGTLGLITEISLKTQAMPETAATLTLEGLDLARAVAAMSAALGTPYDVTGAAFIDMDAHVTTSQTHLRIEGFETSVTYRAERLAAVLAPFDAVQIEMNADTTDTIWAGLRDVVPFAKCDGDIWSVSLKPSDASTLVEAISPEGLVADWGGGRLWLRTVPDTDVRAAMTSNQIEGHATLVRAAKATKQVLGVFHPQAPLVAKLSAGLRHQFDPEQKFNRGMMG